MFSVHRRSALAVRKQTGSIRVNSSSTGPNHLRSRIRCVTMPVTHLSRNSAVTLTSAGLYTRTSSTFYSKAVWTMEWRPMNTFWLVCKKSPHCGVTHLPCSIWTMVAPHSDSLEHVLLTLCTHLKLALAVMSAGASLTPMPPHQKEKLDAFVDCIMSKQRCAGHHDYHFGEYGAETWLTSLSHST